MGPPTAMVHEASVNRPNIVAGPVTVTGSALPVTFEGLSFMSCTCTVTAPLHWLAVTVCAALVNASFAGGPTPTLSVCIAGSSPGALAVTVAIPGTEGVNPGIQSEAFSALVALGYKPPEVTRLLKLAEAGAETTEDLIRRALQVAAKR